MTNDELLELERLLADALTSADPALVIQKAADDSRTSDALRPALAAIDRDGLRIAALLVAKLRFERLLQGSSSAGEWFDSDLREFTAAFRRYHLEVAPHAATPSEEAARFGAWTSAQETR